MTTDTFTKAELALLAWRNAPNRSAFQELRCLALVQRNRVRAGWHGGDWLQVIAADPIYSAYVLPNGNGHAAAVDGENPELAAFAHLASAYPDPRNEIWKRFLWEVDKIYDGSANDEVTAGALWWAEADKITRPWFLEKIARDPEHHARVAQCGPITLWA